MLVARVAVTLALLLLSRPSADAEQETLPSFAEPVKNVTATEGRDATLVCLTENLSNYKVAWVKVDTQTILTIGSHLITRNYQISLTESDGRIWYLRIRNVDRNDTGWYMCQINTDPMISQMGYLEVVEPPDIVLNESSDDMLVDEGVTTELRCVAHGYPTPVIKWHREDRSRPLRSGPDLSINGTELVFSPVRRHHMGVYLCVASNGIPPSVSKRIVLQVQFAPVVNASSQMLSAAQGTAVTLQCNTEAHPRSVTYWMKTNADVVASGTRYQEEDIVDGYKLTMQLKIFKVDGADFTSYRCVAKNPFGEAEATVRLTERQPTLKERQALQSDRYDAELRRQQKLEAAREAARRREQRRLEQEVRRQRGQQAPQQERERPNQDRQHHTAITNIVAKPPEQRDGSSASAASGRRPPLGACLLLPLLLPLLLARRASRGC